MVCTDLGPLVARGAATNKSFIGVGINYRLGYFGYIALPNNKTSGNLGLYDQRLALQWIQKHIAGFGGDPDKVTIGGISAGSMSVDAHLNALAAEEQKELRLFRRAAMLSGAMMSAPPLSVEHQVRRAKGFGELIAKKLAAQGKGVHDWAEAYSTATVRDFLQLFKETGVKMMHPTLDGEWFEKEWKPYSRIPSWCEAIFIGDCAFEVQYIHHSAHNPRTMKINLKL